MKQIVIEATQINYGDDRGGLHQDVGDIVDVPKAEAAKLAQAGRCLYVDRKDDPDKTGRHTATKDMLRAAAELAAAKAKDKAAKTEVAD
jgi:hypothetical protein